MFGVREKQGAPAQVDVRQKYASGGAPEPLLSNGSDRVDLDH